MIIIFTKIALVTYLMLLSYSENIQQVESKQGVTCIDNRYSNASGVSYRFVHDDIEHPDNFKPIAAIRHIPNPRCNHWSLSFYNSEENAIKAFNSIVKKSKKKKKNLDKSFGDYLALGELSTTDGYKGEENEEGHFECFTISEIDLSSKFEIIKKLI